MATVLSSRGILTPEEARDFTESGIESLPDPMLITGMGKAVERIKRAIEDKEPVAVFGDYDVDGITASCVLVKYLSKKGLSCRLIIPECREDGYGLSEKTVDEAAKAGIKLGVTVDCGITSVSEAEYAASLGMDIIITDHHECGLKTPQAVAVVDPKIPGCEYPCKHLAGVGVAFSLVWACEGIGAAEELLEEFSDLVALGTVADVMPVTGANRILVKKGLEVMRRGERPGIACLARASGIDISTVTASVIGFSLGPRLNAAGRMGETSLAVKLMLSETEEEAQSYAEALCEKNTCRRALESKMFEEALSLAESQPVSSAPLVVASENWHLGVAGIVASRLVERLYRPAVVICISDGVGRGSCRSVKGYSIHGALEAQSDILTAFGGHEMAAGLTVPADKIDELRERLSRLPSGETASGPTLDVDFSVIKPGLLTCQNVSALNVLEPYGGGNAQPVLCFLDAYVEAASGIGGGKHSKYRISKNGESFEGVFFGRPVEEGPSPGETVDVAFTPQINDFRGRCSVQLVIVDIRRREGE